MDSFRKISLHSRLWIAVLAVAALSIGTWSIAPAPANAGGVIGVGIPSLYAQYPYYPYPPGYYPYYVPPVPAYSPAPSYTAGLPTRRRDFQRQYRRKPLRCQRTSVSGLKTTAASSTEGNSR